MLWPRRVFTILFGAWIASWTMRALLDWILGFEGTWVDLAIVAAALAGGALSIPAARELEPWSASAERDALLGWGTIVAIVLVLPCFALPMPWGIVAAGVVAAAAVVALRQVAKATAGRVADAEPAER
jgi:hypothetical protein